ncbi:Bestrophin, RFP-TM, chloride channel-domain-containing protein [Panaeolus papilionaceus]|nr:Bestrophin, RFP-TM, chloride channel-domain-containing protein [Panaeolus papilionaceus]
MVASNPLFVGRWTWKKFGATVIDDIWPEVSFFTLVATMVALVSKKTSVNLGVSNQLLTVLGIVLGLVISFRTSSAYERYQDGRKLWSNIIVNSKNLAQLIWIHVPNERKSIEGEEPWTKMDVIIEKKTMVNLVQAFSVSVKHLLRGESGVYYEDLYPLLSFLPRYANDPINDQHSSADRLPLWYLRDEENHLRNPAPPTPIVQSTSNLTQCKTHPARDNTLVEGKIVQAPDIMERLPELEIQQEFDSSSSRPFTTPIVIPVRPDKFDPVGALPTIECDRPLLPARNPPDISVMDYFPILRLFRFIYRTIFCRKNAAKDRRRRRRKAYAHIVESHVPMEICMVLLNYSAFLVQDTLIRDPIVAAMTDNILSMQDTVCNLERICNTPLPFAYQAHLRMSLWLYLVLLPFQMYSFFGYITIPATAFTAFLLVGFLEIGQEIENPFNYDLNDLDLDGFCLSIQRDLQEITTFTSPLPRKFLYSKLNQPFAPGDRRSADELKKAGDEYSNSSTYSPTQGVSSINRTLVSSWRQTDMMTRQR